MGVFNTDTFLNLLAGHIATTAGTSTVNYAGTPRALWRYQAVEGAQCADPYSVMVPYAGGEVAWAPVARVPVQILTVGTTMSAAVNRANLIMACFLDSQGRPKRMIDLGSSYRLAACTVRPPVNLPPDERGRSRVALNIDARGANVG